MHRPRPVLRRAALGGLLLLGCAAIADSSAPESAAPRPRPDLSSHSLELRAFNALLLAQGQQVDVVLAGDSILATLRLPDLWPDALVVNRAIGGDDSGNLRARFVHDVLALRPRQVVLCIGTNDFWWSPEVGRAPDPERAIHNLVANVAAMRDMCAQAGADLLVCSLLPVNPLMEWGAWRTPYVPVGTHARANMALAGECQRTGIPFLDLHGEFVDDLGRFDARYTNDGVHPNVAAQRLIVERIRAAVETAVPAD